MATNVQEISPLFALEYAWDINDVDQDQSLLFSKKFMYQNMDMFQAGMKMAATHQSSNPAFFFLLTTNLQKMGLKMLTVLYTVNGSAQDNEMQEMNLNNEVENGPGIQLFTSPMKLSKKQDKPVGFCFFFTIYLTGIVNTYRVRQTDGLLSRQLWSSVTDRQDDGTDFNLIANDGKILPVHKWILAARSPVFAVLFSGEEDQVDHPMDCTVDEMKQFIKFIYTGELEGLTSHELMHLAAKYEIKTLEDLCQSAFQDTYAFTMDKLAMMALHLECGSHPICLNDEAAKNNSDVDLSEMQNEYIISPFTCSWNVQDLGKKKGDNEAKIKTTVPFELEGKKLFRAELEMIENPNKENHQDINLKFLSYGHGQRRCQVYEVKFSIAQDQNNVNHQPIGMDEAHTNHADLLQVFATNGFPTRLINPLIHSFSVTFHVKLRNTVYNYINKPLDSTWSGHLWAAAVNKKMTDVEFLVGEEVFSAHRSLLSARSPVFAAMFASGMKEAESGRVTIEDVDPTTFKRFLQFLYTGMLEFPAMDEELFTVADKYQVETLMELCRRRPATQPIDTMNGAILKTFFSC